MTSNNVIDLFSISYSTAFTKLYTEIKSVQMYLSYYKLSTIAKLYFKIKSCLEAFPRLPIPRTDTVSARAQSNLAGVVIIN